MENDLKALVKRAMEGDRAAYGQLCERKAKDVLYICTKITGNLADGEDAAQEVFVQLQSGILRLKSAEAFPAWLNRVVAFTCSNLRRKTVAKALLPWDEKVVELVEEDSIEFLPAQLAEHNESREAVLDALDRLPAHYREALIFFYFDGMTLRELADMRGTDVKSVQNLLFRARRAMRNQLEGTHTLPAVAPLAFGALPTLTRILRLDAEALIPAESIAGVAAAATGAGTTALVAKTGAAAMAAKVCLPLLAGFAIAGSTIYGISAGQSASMPVFFPQEAPVAIAAASEGSASEAPPGGTAFTASGARGASEVIETETTTPPSLGGQRGVDTAPGQQATTQPLPPAEPGGEPEAPVTLPEDEAPVYTLQGALVFATNTGQPVKGLEAYADGLQVNAVQNGQTVASAVANRAGKYTLTLPPGTYTLELLVGTGFGQVGGTQVEIAAGLEVLPDMYYTDLAPPTGSVAFTGAGGQDMKGSSVNPDKATLQVLDATPTTVSWQVVTGAGLLLHSGKGADVGLAKLGLATSAQGIEYTLRYTVKDSAGNTTKMERQFLYIDT